MPADRSIGTVRMDGAHRSGMPGVDGAQEGHGLLPAHFAQDDAIKPHTQRGDQKILYADISLAQRAAYPDSANRHPRGKAAPNAPYLYQPEDRQPAQCDADGSLGKEPAPLDPIIAFSACLRSPDCGSVKH